MTLKSLTADSGCNMILAKVAQVGADGKVGSFGSFTKNIVKKEYNDRNPQRILETVYEVVKNRKFWFY